MKKKYAFPILNTYKPFAIFLLFTILLNLPVFAQVFPSGFSKVKIATLDGGSAMAFAPDGRIFVCKKEGEVRIIKDGALLPTPAMTLTVDANGERGLGAIAFDPDFSTNQYIYVYYTATTPTLHNRLSRFTMNGDVVLAGSEMALLDAETVNSVFHNGGGLGFGPDGKLYLSMGEDNSPNNSQNLTTYKGKMLRLNADGTAPTDNPYYSNPSAVTKKIWSLGLRNPYTLAFQPVTGKLYVNNVGADGWEEIHDATLADQNFGWPTEEGYSTDPNFDSPVFAYPHPPEPPEPSFEHQGCAITGGAFFNPASTNYPSEYIGKYFYMDYCYSWIYYLTPGASASSTNTPFATGMGDQILAMQVGPDGNLYYLRRKEDNPGVYKIIYTNTTAPGISAQPANITVVEGQPAAFEVSATGATPLNYQWKKNGMNAGTNSTTYSISATAQSDAGSYSVVVTNGFGTITSNTVTLTVLDYNAPPIASIITPTTGTYFRAGDVINFSGSANDPEDGDLPGSAFEWTIEFWHNNNHFHPGQVLPTGIVEGSFITSNTDHTSANIYYKLKLKVTDSNGLTDMEETDILPMTSNLMFNTVPPGLQITYDSQPFSTPFTPLTVEGLMIQIGIVSPQDNGNGAYVFDHWQQGGNASQTINIGAGDSSYIAIFRDTAIACTATGTILHEYWNNLPGGEISSIPLNTPAFSTSYPTIFEAPSIGDSTGARMRGYLCAPASGSYTFWIASDNNSELWLSTDNNPANKQKIASVMGWTGSQEWTKYPSQQSTPVTLTAGGRYYVEVLHKQSDGGDNLAVGWQLPDATKERPIPGTRLSPYNPSIFMLQNPELCPGEKIIVGSNTYSVTGIYADAFTAQNGSDSTVITNLKVNHAASYSQSITLCSGEKLTVNTNTYSITGTYEDIYVGSNGCDSIVATMLTVNGPINNTVTVAGSILTANLAGAGYQWIDCVSGNTPIFGETSQSYTATASGNYAIIVTKNGCSDTSACFLITGINDHSQAAILSIIPNPNNGNFTVSSGQAGKFILINSLGQLIKTIELNSGNNNTATLKEIENGVYFIMSSSDSRIKHRIVVTR